MTFLYLDTHPIVGHFEFLCTLRHRFWSHGVPQNTQPKADLLTSGKRISASLPECRCSLTPHKVA